MLNIDAIKEGDFIITFWSKQIFEVIKKNFNKKRKVESISVKSERDIEVDIQDIDFHIFEKLED